MLLWEKLLCFRRLGKPEGNPLTNPLTGRSEFESDVDRITFSTSFRRLARKTQVFPLEQNDHVHNRLTHSLEVSRVGKTLGLAVGNLIPSLTSSNLPKTFTPYDIASVVEAACLAHDIGHPPFGHAGDRAIKHWFAETKLADEIKRSMDIESFNDLTNFDGNAQGFRRISQLEKNLFQGGLNLTYATLASYIKYPFCESSEGKCGFFKSESEIVKEIADHCDLEFNKNRFIRHPLSYLVEAADDICYGILDLEDAVEMEVLELQEVAQLLLNALPDEQRNKYSPSIDDRSHRVVFSKMRGKIFGAAIQEVVEAFKRQYPHIMNGQFESDLLSNARDFGGRAANTVLMAKSKAKSDVFRYGRKVHIELSSFAILARLMEDFSFALLEFSRGYKNNPSNPCITIKSEVIINLLGDHKPNYGNPPPNKDWTTYECLKRGLDFIAGMTDDFALKVSRELSGHIER